MSATAAAAPPRAPNASARDWIAVLSIVLGAFLAILDIQITNASLANIEGSIGATSSDGSWISTSYLIAEIIVIPLSGWLCFVIGLKRYLIANCSLFVLFSIACALSSSLTELILFRAGQGFTGGVLIPLAINILRVRLPQHQQPMGIAMFGVSATFAPSLGPAIGGWLTDNFSWHYLFYLNVLPGLLAIGMQTVALDPERARWSELARGDWPGMTMMAAGLASLTVVLEEGQRLEWFGSPLIRILSVVAVLSTSGFVIRQLLIPDPFLDVRLLGRRSIGMTSLISTVLGGVSLGSVYIIPLYCTAIHNYNPEQIGYIVMWSGLPQLLMYPMIPFLMRNLDLRLVTMTGVVIFTVSCYLNTHMTADVGTTQLIVPQILRGLGQPLFFGPLTQIASSGLTRQQLPHATALFAMLRNLGGSICIATISTIVERREQFHFSAISEHVTRNALATQQRIQALQVARAGAGPFIAHQQALTTIALEIRRQATVMSFSDAFVIIVVSMILCTLSLLLLKPASLARR